MTTQCEAECDRPATLMLPAGSSVLNNEPIFACDECAIALADRSEWKPADYDARIRAQVAELLPRFLDDPYDRALAQARLGCCEERRKPCPYHEGWADGFETAQRMTDPATREAQG